MASRLVINQAELDQLLESEEGGVGRDLLRRALSVERAAKQAAPVDTGRLRSSVTHALDRDGQGLFAIIGSDVEYAIFQELGTRFMSAQPFLAPALGAAG